MLPIRESVAEDIDALWRAGFKKRCQEAFDARMLRERRPISYDELAQEASDIVAPERVTRSTVYRWMAGESMPSVSRIQVLAQVLNVSPLWLAFGDDPVLPTSARRGR